MQKRVITSPIERDELEGLLESSSDPERITARIPAVTLEHLLRPEDPPVLPVVTFRRMPRASERMPPVREADLDAMIDAAVDAAIDAEIHNAEIDAAIDAVVLPDPPPVEAPRYLLVALAFVLALITGMAVFAAV